jgi:hypothetical protein
MIQDDARETELVKLFNLTQTEGRKRSDIDAFLDLDGKRINFELKSTTVRSVSTASPLTINHLEKWKDYHWIIGVYDKETEALKYCYYGSPDDMRGWLDFMIEDIQRGLKSSKYLREKIDLPMMFDVLGEKLVYSYKDAKHVFKNLFSKKEYNSFKDLPDGYSQAKMLEMFKLHNYYYLEKGSWLNNPKIGPKVYTKWKKITKNYSESLLKILKGEPWDEENDKKPGDLP